MGGAYGSQKMSKVEANLCIKPCCSEQGIRSQTFRRPPKPPMRGTDRSWRPHLGGTDRECAFTDRASVHPASVPRLTARLHGAWTEAGRRLDGGWTDPSNHFATVLGTEEIRLSTDRR